MDKIQLLPWEIHHNSRRQDKVFYIANFWRYIRQGHFGGKQTWRLADDTEVENQRANTRPGCKWVPSQIPEKISISFPWKLTSYLLRASLI